MDLSLMVPDSSFMIDKLHLRKQMHFIWGKLPDTEMLRTDVSGLQDFWRTGLMCLFCCLLLCVFTREKLGLHLEPVCSSWEGPLYGVKSVTKPYYYLCDRRASRGPLRYTVSLGLWAQTTVWLFPQCSFLLRTIQETEQLWPKLAFLPKGKKKNESLRS